MTYFKITNLGHTSISSTILSYIDSLKIKSSGDDMLVWDVIRKKWLVQQPEEMVRQLFIQYLINECLFPLSRIQIEKQVKVNNQSRRFDLLVYDWEVKPFMLIECKSFNIPIAQTTLDQVTLYNYKYKAPFICITNGHQTQVFAFENQKYTPNQSIPNFPIHQSNQHSK